MHKKRTALILAFAGLTLLVSGQESNEPADLTKLRDSWQRAIQQANAPLDRKYAEALNSMKARFTKKGKLQEALSVDSELKILSERAATPQPAAATGRVRHKWTHLARSPFATAKQLAEKEGGHLPQLKTEDDQKSFMKFFEERPTQAAWLDASYDATAQRWVLGRWHSHHLLQPG